MAEPSPFGETSSVVTRRTQRRAGRALAIHLPKQGMSRIDAVLAPDMHMSPRPLLARHGLRLLQLGIVLIVYSSLVGFLSVLGAYSFAAGGVSASTPSGSWASCLMD